jgi:hypothetical protein
MTRVFINLESQSAEELMQRLINAICQYRLYTDVQLQALFQQAIRQNESNEVGAEAAE